MGGQAQGGHGNGQQCVIQLNAGADHGFGQHAQRVHTGHGHKAHGKPGDGDLAACLAGVHTLGPLAARQPHGQNQQKWGQHHHSHHLGDHGHISGLAANGFTGGHNLGHLMHGGADKQAVLVHIGVDPAKLRIPVEQRGVEESAHGAKHHHGSHGHGHIFGTALGHGLGRQHGGCAADGAARANQQRGAFVHAQQLLAHPLGQQKGAGQHQRINHHPGHADLANVLKRQAQAVEDDARAQQSGLGKAHAAGAAAGDGGVDGVADDQTDDDGQRQRAQAVVLDGGKLGQPGGDGGNCAGQQQAGQHGNGLVGLVVLGGEKCCCAHETSGCRAHTEHGWQRRVSL